MRICAYSSCENSDVRSPGKRFFGVPKDTVRRSKWEECCRENPQFVCEDHFSDDAFQPQDVLLNLPRGKWKLKKDAVPMPPDLEEETVRCQRTLIRERKRIVQMAIKELDSRVKGKKPSTPAVEDVKQRKQLVEELIAEHDFPELKIRKREMERIAKENPIVGMEEIVEETGNVIWISPDDNEINDEEEKVDQKYFSHYCRLCLADVHDENTATNLFLPIDGYGCVSQELFGMFQINLSQSERLSSIVCGDCLQFLRNIKLFKEKIQLSQKTVEEIPSIDDSTMEIPPKPENEEIEERDFQEIIENYSESDSDYFLPEPPQISKRVPKKSNTITVMKRTRKEKAQLQELMKTMNLLKCDICKEETESFSKLLSHQRDEHRPTTGYLFCCDTRWSYSDRAYDHMAFHQNPDTFKCWTCDEQFMCIGDLQRHQRKSHDRWFICEICSKKFKKLWGLKHHQMRHREKFKRSDKCSYCGKLFVGTADLKRHVERVHEIENRCVCEVCGKWFSNSNTLWTHRKNHETRGQKRNPSTLKVDGLITCSICKREVRSLSFHMRIKHKVQIRTENDLEKIPCPTCGVQFARYRIHMHIYRQHKKKACKFCPLKFVSHSEWMAHKNEHLGLEFPCQYCEKVWTTNLGRYFHVKSCHPEEHKELMEEAKRRKVAIAEKDIEILETEAGV